VTQPNSRKTEALKTGSPREYIVRDIIRGLYEGRYVPGQRLIESDLTADYRTSRGPVREALNWLSAHGIVSLIPQRGAQVRRLSQEEAQDILVVVEPLIGLAARLAAGRIGWSTAASRLRDALERLAGFDPTSSGPDYAQARDSFYGALLEIGGSTELRRVMPSVLVHLVRVQYREVLKIADAQRHADYRAIAREVFAGRPDAAEAAARAHIARQIAALRNSAGALPENRG
jgi:DNA-binding GntR family transcriptional regulator